MNKKQENGFLKSKLNKFLIAISLLGLVIIGLMVPYYLLPGIGAPEGDGDFGGVIFIFTGVPVVVIGLAGLLLSGILRLIGTKQTAGWQILKFVALAILLPVILYALWMLLWFVGGDLFQSEAPDRL